MTMFSTLRARKRDMRTLSALMSTSLERAGRDGGRLAGAHDLLVAALELDDGTAEEVFARLGSSGSAFVAAIDEQDAEALRSLGIDEPTDAGAGTAASAGTARPSGTDATYDAAIRNIHAVHNEGAEVRALVGAHVVAGVAEVERGVAARALRVMGLRPADVVTVARAVAEEAS